MPAASTRRHRVNGAAFSFRGRTRCPSPGVKPFLSSAGTTNGSSSLKKHLSFLLHSAPGRSSSKASSSNHWRSLSSKWRLDYIPTTLEPRTQLVLRSLMQQPVLDSDASGYIYALELVGAWYLGTDRGVCDLGALRLCPPKPHPHQGRTKQ